MFTERCFKPKVTNQQSRTDVNYHDEPLCAHLVQSTPSVTNVKIKRIVLIYISQILSQPIFPWNLYSLIENKKLNHINIYIYFEVLYISQA